MQYSLGMSILSLPNIHTDDMLTKGFMSSLEHWGNVETFGFKCDDVIDVNSKNNVATIAPSKSTMGKQLFTVKLYRFVD